MSTNSPAPGTPQTTTKAQLAALGTAITSLVTAFVVSWISGKTGVNLSLPEIAGAIAGAGGFAALWGFIVKAIPNKPTSTSSRAIN